MEEYKTEDKTRCMYLLNSRKMDNPIYKEMGCLDCDGTDRDCDYFYSHRKGLEDNLYERN